MSNSCREAMLAWGLSSSGALLLHRLAARLVELGRTQRGRMMDNIDSKPIAFPCGRYTAAEFARLSLSLRLTLIIIRRAQISSRKAIAAIAGRKMHWE